MAKQPKWATEEVWTAAQEMRKEIQEKQGTKAANAFWNAYVALDKNSDNVTIETLRQGTISQADVDFAAEKLAGSKESSDANSDVVGKGGLAAAANAAVASRWASYGNLMKTGVAYVAGRLPILARLVPAMPAPVKLAGSAALVGLTVVGGTEAVTKLLDQLNGDAANEKAAETAKFSADIKAAIEMLSTKLGAPTTVAENAAAIAPGASSAGSALAA